MRIVLVLVAWVQECCVAKEQRGTRMNVAQAKKQRGTRTNVARERKQVWLHQCRYLIYACTIAECNCVACHSSV